MAKTTPGKEKTKLVTEIVRDRGQLNGHHPTHEEISRRAYDIFLSRGGEHGRADEDWLQAERELKGE
jgi:hypothetical protein